MSAMDRVLFVIEAATAIAVFVASIVVGVALWPRLKK